MIANLLFWAIPCVIVALLVCIETKRMILSKRFRHIKGVPELPIVGSSYTFRSNQIKDIHLLFNDVVCDKVSKIFVGPVCVFFVSDPQAIQSMFTGTTFAERPFLFGFFRLPFGIITSKYHIWKPVRKSLNPAFSQRMSLSFIPVFEKHFDTFCSEIRRANGAPIDINDISVKMGINIILETNFGVTDVPESFEGHLFEKFEDNICQRIATPAVWFDYLYQKSSLCKEDRKIDHTMTTLFRNLISTREKFWKDRPKDPDAVNGGRLFIDEILSYVREQNFENDDLLIQNMITIFMAGYETAALTVSYSILLLAMHPEIQERVVAEILEHHEPGQPIDHELLRKLRYLEMVIKEALRLFPPAPITARENMEPAFVEKIGKVDKNSIFVLSFYNLHRWKDIWGEDANEFNPEHFSEENNAKRHPYAFLPFSGGAKTCIGYQYAMINIKVGLVSLLSQFRFTTDLKMSDLEYKFSVTMKLLNKYLVTAHPRSE